MPEQTPQTEGNRTWDARLAAFLVTPFVATAISPNHFTTLRLVVGLVGAYFFTLGTHPNLAAFLIIASNFIDHADGELARLSGKTSEFGHLYDLAADALVTILLFICIGIGLATTETGSTPVLMGVMSGGSVAMIFHLRNHMETKGGKTAVAMSTVAGFEAEDILYLLPLVTLCDVLPQFLLAACIGAPVAAILVTIHFLYWRRQQQ